jgi:hypothetical protein
MKLDIKLDAAKLRNLVKTRSYKNKEGVEVQVQEIEVQLVPLKESKETFKNEKVTITKTHFLAAKQTKEQREAKEAAVYVGEGFTVDYGQSQTAAPASTENDNSLPF